MRFLRLHVRLSMTNVSMSLSPRSTDIYQVVSHISYQKKAGKLTFFNVTIEMPFAHTENMIIIR